MKGRLCLAALLVLHLAVGASASELTVAGRMASMPLAFTENQGQWDGMVLFRADAGGAVMWFTADGAYYQFTRRMPGDDAQGETGPPETMMIKATFVGANPHPHMSGEGLLDYKCNYFIGNDPAKWRTDVANYTAVVYEEVYPGIDLRYYGSGRAMEYDFVVSPGADYSRIQVRYEGVESVSVNGAGELVVKTQWGEVIERRPVVYQVTDDLRVPVAGEYSLSGDGGFGFDVTGSYDTNAPLFIDPILSYSTYLGGSEPDIGRGIAVDASGAAYIALWTISGDFPLLNPFQSACLWESAAVTKLDPSGSSLSYSTFLGGNDIDEGNSIAVDASGAAYVVGFTASWNFPVTENALQGTHEGGTWDVFVTKLSSTGASLVYSTYLGGLSDDNGYAIAVDAYGSAYVTGSTSSPDFPTQNPYQTDQGGADVFVAKLNATGSALLYSTYLGGGGAESGSGITVDAYGAAYVTGGTSSTDFPTHEPYQTDPGDGYSDVFVTKLNSTGNSLVYSTYLGGSGSESGSGIAVDDYGAAYVTGGTGSLDYPTQEAYQGINAGGSDAFVTKLSSTGNSLIYSTYLGGSSGESGSGIAIDDYGAAYVTGGTSSLDFPVKDAYQSTNAGGSDVFVTKLSGSGNSLIYSTYLGGSGSDGARAIAAGASGSAYLTGWTTSADFPLENAFQSTYHTGWWDAFVTKFLEEQVSCCQVPGDVNHDGVVDLLDFQYLRDYVHKDGPEPPCFEEADVNGDGEVTKEDVSCMARYLFSSGNTCVFVECQ